MEKKEQTRTSKATSINRSKLPAVYSRFEFTPQDVVFDFGCGRFTDHIAAALPEGAIYLPYDPFNQPEAVNDQSVFAFKMLARFSRRRLVLVCSNVLNVIDSDDALQDIADQIAGTVLHTGAVAYITVYEGDRTGHGRETGPDQWQRNEKLRDYIRFFPGCNVTVMNNTIVIK